MQLGRDRTAEKRQGHERQQPQRKSFANRREEDVLSDLSRRARLHLAQMALTRCILGMIGVMTRTAIDETQNPSGYFFRCEELQLNPLGRPRSARSLSLEIVAR